TAISTIPVTPASAPVTITISTLATIAARLVVTVLGFRVGARFHGLLARQTNLAAVVDTNHLHDDLVADLADVFHFFHAAVFQFTDVNQSVLAGQNLNEAAK